MKRTMDHLKSIRWKPSSRQAHVHVCLKSAPLPTSTIVLAAVHPSSTSSSRGRHRPAERPVGVRPAAVRPVFSSSDGTDAVHAWTESPQV
jgi:hypothetical protein